MIQTTPAIVYSIVGYNLVIHPSIHPGCADDAVYRLSVQSKLYTSSPVYIREKKRVKESAGLAVVVSLLPCVCGTCAVEVTKELVQMCNSNDSFICFSLAAAAAAGRLRILLSFANQLRDALTREGKQVNTHKSIRREEEER